MGTSITNTFAGYKGIISWLVVGCLIYIVCHRTGLNSHVLRNEVEPSHLPYPPSRHVSRQYPNAYRHTPLS